MLGLLTAAGEDTGVARIEACTGTGGAEGMGPVAAAGFAGVEE